LAEEADTKEVKPSPLPLVELLSGKEIKTVGEAKEHREKLREGIDFEDGESIAGSVLQLCDIIEGVKYKFEPKELCVLIKEEDLSGMKEVNVNIMDEKLRKGNNIYIGYEPPEGATHLGRVATTAAFFALNAKKHKIVFKTFLGHKTLILNAITFALRHYENKE